jgi:hypothetical protein
MPKEKSREEQDSIITRPFGDSGILGNCIVDVDQ